MLRDTSQRVRALRCVFEETPTVERILQRLRLRNIDESIFGDRYREGTIAIEPGTMHFDLRSTDVVRRNLQKLVALAADLASRGA